jgi:hypothetical protein
MNITWEQFHSAGQIGNAKGLALPELFHYPAHLGDGRRRFHGGSPILDGTAPCEVSRFFMPFILLKVGEHDQSALSSRCESRPGFSTRKEQGCLWRRPPTLSITYDRSSQICHIEAASEVTTNLGLMSAPNQVPGFIGVLSSSLNHDSCLARQTKRG